MGHENFAQIHPKRRKFFAGADTQTDGLREYRCTLGSENNAFFNKSKVVLDLLKSDFDFMH